MSLAGIGLSQLSITPTVAGSARENEPDVSGGQDVPLAAGAVQKDEQFANDMIQARVKALHKKYLQLTQACDLLCNEASLKGRCAEDVGFELDTISCDDYRKLYESFMLKVKQHFVVGNGELFSLQRGFYTALKKADYYTFKLVQLDEEDVRTVANDLANCQRQPPYAGKFKRIANLILHEQAATKAMKEAQRECVKALDHLKMLKSEFDKIDLGPDPIDHPDTIETETEFEAMQSALGLGNTEKMDAARKILVKIGNGLVDLGDTEALKKDKEEQLETISKTLSKIAETASQEISTFPQIIELLLANETLPYDGPCKNEVEDYSWWYRMKIEREAEIIELEKVLNVHRLNLLRNLKSIGIQNHEIDLTKPEKLFDKVQLRAEWLSLATSVMAETGYACSSIVMTPKPEEIPFVETKDKA